MNSPGCRSRTVADYSRHLALLGFKCQLSEVSLNDLERKLNRLTPGEYNHRLVAAKTFFKWAQKRRYIEHDPTVSLSAHAAKKRKRILTDVELKAVWTAAGQIEGYFGTIVKLLIATGQRRGEIAALQRSYYSHNNQTICLPSELTKNGREHTFPMGSLASAVLPKGAPQSLYIFPAKGKQNSCFNGWSKSKVALDKLLTIDPWTLHDLRRTYRSNLARLGVPPHIAERLVNHISARTQMEETYDIYAYMPEMQKAVETYESWLLKSVAG